MKDVVAAVLGPHGGLSPGSLPALTTPILESHGDEFLVRWDDHRVEFVFNSIREGAEGLHAELAVRHEGEEILWSRLNLASSRSREGVVKTLAQAQKAIPWPAMIDRASRLTALQVRQGSPTFLLKARPASRPRFLLEPLLPLGETSLLFGDGGAGKGFAALAVALAIMAGVDLPGGLRASARGPILYLDWESVPEEIEDRLYLLSRGLSCSINGLHYRRMSRGLAEEAPALRAEVSRLGIGLVIVDSLAPAAGPEPEGADAANRTMNALRSLGIVTRLVIAHMTHVSAQQRAGAARPFGSVFYWNLARSVWDLRRSEEEAGDDLVVGLYHRKVNRGRLHPPIGLRFAFGPDAITLHRADLGEAPDLLARASLPQRIRAVLAGGRITTEAVIEALDAPEDTVRRTLRRLAGKGYVLRLEVEGRVFWGLPA